LLAVMWVRLVPTAVAAAVGSVVIVIVVIYFALSAGCSGSRYRMLSMINKDT
jgi:hypothetical protein